MAETAAATMSQAQTTGQKLNPSSVDDLGRALLTLATEVSVLADRQRVLEAVLGERGIDVADAVRDYQPSGAIAQGLKDDKQRLAKLIVEALCPPTA